jgi:hypothetical protein
MTSPQKTSSKKVDGTFYQGLSTWFRLPETQPKSCRNRKLKESESDKASMQKVRSSTQISMAL